MTVFGRDILQKLQGETLEDNPLEIIGLSPAILDLGLSNEMLYEHCRRIARDLFRRVHPDVHGGVVTPAMERFSKAFSLLDDNRKAFEAALRRFREKRTYQQQHEKILRLRIRNLAEEVASLENQLRAKDKACAEEIKRRLWRQQAEYEEKTFYLRADLQKARLAADTNKKVREWVYGYLVGKSLRFAPSAEEIKPIGECARLTVVSLAFAFTPYGNDDSGSRREEIKRLYDMSVRRAKADRRQSVSRADYATLCSKILEYNLAAVPVAELVQIAIDSRLRMPMVHWCPTTAAVRKLNLTKMIPGSSPMGRRAKIIRSSVSLRKPELSVVEKYRDILACLAQAIGEKYVVRAAIVPERISFRHGHLEGDSISRGKLYVIGSADLEKSMACLKTPRSRQSLSRLEVMPEVLLETEPIVFPGRALISVRAPRSIGTEGKSTEEIWTSFLEKKKSVQSKKQNLFLSHIVLDV
jgi:hypothetical protein